MARLESVNGSTYCPSERDPSTVGRGTHHEFETCPDWGAVQRAAPQGGIHGFDLHCSYGMVLGMATTKITITLQADQVEAIRALVAAGRSANVSAFVQHAVGIALFDAAGWKEMLEDALQQTGGPLSKKERDWADTLLSPERQKRGSRKGNAA